MLLLLLIVFHSETKDKKQSYFQMNGYIQNIKLREIKTRARQDVIKSVNVPSCSCHVNALSHKHDKSGNVKRRLT